jgi:FixJ family two-component response regulator
MDGSGRPLRCVVVEDDAAVRTVIALALRGFEVQAPDFTSTEEVLQTCDRVAPDVVFLDIALQNFDAVDVIRALGSEGYRGAVQLVSGHHTLMHAIRRIGERNGLTMLEPVAKPFHASTLRRAAEEGGERAATA